MREVWEVGRQLRESDDGDAYWRAITRVMLAVTGQSGSRWQEAQAASLAVRLAQAGEQIAFLEGQWPDIISQRARATRCTSGP